MKIAFDLDGTLVSNDDRILRPGALKVLKKLKDDGHEVYLWSYGGQAWASFWNSHSINFPFTDIFDKRAHKISKETIDLAVDNDGIGVPNGTLTYWCDDFSNDKEEVEDLDNVLIVVNELKNKGGFTKEFLKTPHINYLIRFEKLRFSDYEDSSNWKFWTERKGV